MPDAHFDSALAACHAALSRSPSGFFTDFDGTISHVASTPAEATLAQHAAPALLALSEVVDMVAIVTGRSAADARSLVSGDHVAIIGNHGLERLAEGQRLIHPAAVGQVKEIGRAMGVIERELAGNPVAEGLVFENKELSGSIHYRLAADRDAAREIISQLVHREASRRGLRVSEGRLVVELRPSVSVNKGTAVVEVIRERSLAGAVFAGDDVTDVDAFNALRDLRNEGISTVSLAVLGSETHPSVAAAADVHVDGVDECVELLTQLAQRLGASS